MRQASRVLLFFAVMATTDASRHAALGEPVAEPVKPAEAAGGASHGLRYVDISRSYPFEFIARATNGTSMRIDRDSDPKLRSAILAASEREQKYTMILAAEGVADTGVAEFEILMDSTMAPLTVNVSGLEARPRVELRDAAGALVTPSESISASTSERLLFDANARGTWKLRVETSPGENVRILVKADTGLRFHHAWPVRPSSDREYKGPLEPGKQEVFDVQLLGDGLKDIGVQLVSLDGRALETGSAGNEGFPLESARVRVTIPGESFRFRIEGERETGERVARTFSSTFDPGKLESIGFYDPAREESEETCRFLSRLGGSSFSDFDKRNPASGSVSCVREEKILRSRLSFTLPVSPDGSPRTVTLRSPDYVQVTQADCERWQQLFERYPRQLTSGGRRASWKFQCTAAPGGATGQFEVTVEGTGTGS